MVRMMEDNKEDRSQRGSAKSKGEQRQRFVERHALQAELAGFPRSASAAPLPSRTRSTGSSEGGVVRASPCFGSQRRAAFDNVAIRCEEKDEDLDCWFGNSARECIFVRWYDVADFTASDRHLEGGYMRLKWEAVRAPGSAAHQPRFEIMELDKGLSAFGLCTGTVH
ncbi:hypothetical protein COCSUDRAFT_60574 [Coccomyxa subellipsoidea C-169]|uniref:Uncharacterized protein n=1 Tax=Coccomyxa subellipsoidea (strain C-169) TaxID=574566 RepID=I0YI57_COCSC|nr:hypothetical protein COCSUDRAFT_60574 [Coccomyxa subellipsoidea C-169]EIE18076.1 hypothetical protein COCSUDRAFT_60574 [Coccomyxa subellipsoidea C-169]|eukprot:XP_005642620.1 hypothetical protein COCSUDRAFT_60574 [Coccomyxa subellipsoidea C-169]